MEIFLNILCQLLTLSLKTDKSVVVILGQHPQRPECGYLGTAFSAPDNIASLIQFDMSMIALVWCGSVAIALVVDLPLTNVDDITHVLPFGLKQNEQIAFTKDRDTHREGFVQL